MAEITRIISSHNTFHYRDELKRLGFRWDANARNWWIDSSRIPTRERARISNEVHKMGFRFYRVPGETKCPR